MERAFFSKRILWLGALCAVAVSVALPVSASAHAVRTCGTFHNSEGTFHLSVLRGRTSCSTARRVLISYWTGHGSPIAGTNATKVDGWTCDSGMGQGSCNLGKSRIFIALPGY